MSSERPRSKWRTVGFYVGYYAFYMLAAFLICLTIMLFHTLLGLDVQSTSVSTPVFFVVLFYAQVRLNERNDKSKNFTERHL